MARIKTSELTGAALNWTVAKIECVPGLVLRGGYLRYPPAQFSDGETYSPSTDWSQGGPIIEREMISITNGSPVGEDFGWFAHYGYVGPETVRKGPTPLIAAMLCFVASNLGDVVEINKGEFHGSN